ncbi:MAG: molybdopterin-dependent oxidoreductase [Deltaproteobacteria bacterium]|nr:molybdopterin-dependent oxidoreductase [Deltaproteobacteria bacterium]
MNNGIHWKKTHCARMDHGGCALLVGVKDNHIIRIKGDPDGYLNKGYTCPKGLASHERLTHPDRLRHPLKRIGERGEGKWERITWSEALETIVKNLRGVKETYGAKAVAFCQGMPKGIEHFGLIRLANTFGSPNVVATQDVCHAPREISGVMTCGFYPVADFHHKSELVILWGSNITATNEEGEICSLLFDQLKQGTDLIVIDPRRTDLGGRAKYWLQIRPGSDNALALAFINVIIQENLYDKDFTANWIHGFNELASTITDYSPEYMSQYTWISPELIRKAARAYAKSRPAAIQWGNPIEQNIQTFDTSRALISLMAICGNLDIAGGNIQANEPPFKSLGKFVRADLLPSKRKEMIHVHHGGLPKLMTIPPAYFKKAVLEGVPYPMKAAYVQCANPLLAQGHSPSTLEAFMNLDFIAVADIFMTPTASLADIVLPAATHFEFNDIGHCGLGHGVLLARPKVVDPPEECWPDIKIINELGKAMTRKEYWYDDYHDILDELLEPTGLDFAQFADMGYIKGEERFQKYLDSGFRTASGKVELMLTEAEKNKVSPLPVWKGPPEKDDPAFPLVLTSAKDPNYLHSSYRWLEPLRKRRPNPLIEIHPETAAKLNIKEGDPVVIETLSGTITQTAKLTDEIHPRVVNAAYGWWFPEDGTDPQYGWKKSNYNMLTSMDKIGKEFGTPNLKGIGCRIRRQGSV